MDTKMKALIAVGASVAANCRPCLTFHIAKATESGADEQELATAIEVARSVRAGAADSMDAFAGSAAGSAGNSSACSGCTC